MLGTLAATAAIAGGIQAAIPASAAALPLLDPITCGRYFDIYTASWERGENYRASMYYYLWETNCVDETEWEPPVYEV